MSTASGLSLSSTDLKCAGKLNAKKEKNPSIYILGELHEQDLQKYFVLPACEGKVTLGIEHYDSDKILSLYDIYCPLPSNLFGFEDEKLFVMMALFRQGIILEKYYKENNEADFSSAQGHIISSLWMSDELETSWLVNRDRIMADVKAEEDREVAQLFDRLLSLKHDKKFKRNVSMLKSFEKTWDKLVTDLPKWSVTMGKRPAFINVVRQLSLSFGDYANMEGLGCFSDYLKDTTNDPLGLYCYYKIADAREDAIYRNIIDNYCDSMDTTDKFVITIGAGHVPNISSTLEAVIGEKVIIETIISRTANEYTLSSLTQSRDSVLKELYASYGEDDFYKSLCTQIDDEINFLSGTRVKVLADDKISYNIVNGYY